MKTAAALPESGIRSPSPGLLYLRNMLKFLESLIIGDAFSTRIKVTFINDADNSVVKEDEMEQQYLPESIKPPLWFFIDNMEWVLVRANPEHADQYSFDKKLVIWLKNPRTLPSSKMNNNPAEMNISFGSNPIQ
jgi:hypothetical protein